MSSLVDLTLREAAGAVADRTVSAVELVQATLDQIAATEPVVHAYAFVAAQIALDNAAALDAELASGHRRGPLHGVPVGVKDLCHTDDMPTEAGSAVLRGHAPDSDATLVARLRAAGAVVVGKTVTHEFAYGQNVPPTRNPWNPACYPGGSSAGSGVAVASRSAFAGIGTDTGGSIRIPSAVNGVVGLKPTFGRVSRNGVIQMSPTLDHAGPMARTVDDCATVFSVIAGFDPADHTSLRVPDFDVESAAGAVDGLTIGIEREYFFEDVQPEVRAAVEDAVRELEEQGVRVVEVSLPELELMPPVALTILLGDTSAYHHTLLRTHRDLYDQGTRHMLELGELIPATHYVTAQRARTTLCLATRRMFETTGIDALVAPTIPRPTIPLDDMSVGLVPGEDKISLGGYVHHAFPANLTGQPALSVPCGFSEGGLPMGLQLMGRPCEEGVLFRLARAYESRHRWHEIRPGVCEPATTSTKDLS